MAKGFKVVKVKYRKLVSCMAYDTISETEYKIKKKTYRVKPHGPLAVFINKKEALKFCRIHCAEGKNLKVFSCRYKRSNATGVWKIFEDDEKTFWSKTSLPYTTDLADYVVLEEEIKC